MSPARDTESRGFGAIAEADPIDDLQSSIAPMLLDVDLREQTLSLLDEERRALATTALGYAARLYEFCEWSPATLLQRLGCQLGVAQLDDVNPPKLARCVAFLRLVGELVALVDTTSDRRAVVMECRRLLRETGQDAAGLEDAFNSGSFSPRQYLELGEISAAGRAVLENLGAASRPSTPYASAPVVHLSNPRIGLFVDGRRDLLGEAQVYDRIAAHIESCDACRTATEHRRASQRAGYSHD